MLSGQDPGKKQTNYSFPKMRKRDIFRIAKLIEEFYLWRPHFLEIEKVIDPEGLIDNLEKDVSVNFFFEFPLPKEMWSSYKPDVNMKWTGRWRLQDE